jgi:molybdopterin-guanine dinucleotide biosynthesis protein A
MPFADPNMAKTVAEAGFGWDICLTLDAEGRPEPLFAYYAKSMLPLVERLMRHGRYSMKHLLESAEIRLRRIRRLKPENFDLDVGSGWEKHTFKNVNTPDDYAAALAIANTAWRK